jgi:NADPH-dependent 2,4-dienoyl-CoA reductase/sulfur reductase-like enzyme
VSIHAVERFLGEQAIANNWPMPVAAPPSGKRVLVIGAGPSGLSAAYHLARLGHQVEIHEAGAGPRSSPLSCCPQLRCAPVSNRDKSTRKMKKPRLLCV